MRRHDMPARGDRRRQIGIALGHHAAGVEHRPRLLAVQQIEQPPRADLRTVLRPGQRLQIGHTRLQRIAHRADAGRAALGPALQHHAERDRQRPARGPAVRSVSAWKLLRHGLHCGFRAETVTYVNDCGRLACAPCTQQLSSRGLCHAGRQTARCSGYRPARSSACSSSVAEQARHRWRPAAHSLRLSRERLAATGLASCTTRRCRRAPALPVLLRHLGYVTSPPGPHEPPRRYA